MNTLWAVFREISEESVSKIQNDVSLLSIKTWKHERKFRVVASTEDVDRSWEVIKVNWWRWKNFMKNPVIIANHIYKVENIIGKATQIYIKDHQLVIEGVFSSSNPLWVLLADLYEEGMIKSVSVWFIPKSRDKGDSKIITEAELLELSFVAVPCNPNALSLDQKSLLENFWMICEIKENEEVWSSSFHENCCGDGGVKDSTNVSIIQKDSENTNRDVLNVLIEIKALLTCLVDKWDELAAKQTSWIDLSWAQRAISAWLERYKKLLQSS